MSHDQTHEETLKGLAIRKKMELPAGSPSSSNRWRTEYKRAVNEWFVYDAGGFLDCTLKSQKAANRIVQMGDQVEVMRESRAALERQATQIAAMADRMLLVLRAVTTNFEQNAATWTDLPGLENPKEPSWIKDARAIVDQFKTVEI